MRLEVLDDIPNASRKDQPKPNKCLWESCWAHSNFKVMELRAFTAYLTSSARCFHTPHEASLVASEYHPEDDYKDVVTGPLLLAKANSSENEGPPLHFEFIKANFKAQLNPLTSL